jgi:isopentenyl diphosphate isomerase/L-lactate dehydrogenase-like FMN-dependent dehydrogenase
MGLTGPDELALAAAAPAGLPVSEDEEAPAIESLPPVTVDDYRRIAQTRLPRPTYEYIFHGSADGYTLRANIDDLQQIKLLPPLLRGISEPDLSTTVLGRKIAMPVLLAPVGGVGMFHPDGALAACRAAHAAGTVAGISSSAFHPVEQIAAAAPGPKWFQLYLPRDRGVAQRLVERVERSGFDAIILTVDQGEWKDCDRRNNFSVPRDMLIRHLREIGFDQVNDRMTDAELTAFNLQAWDLSMTWDVFAWLRSVTKLPLIIKGVLRPDDARKAVELGLDGIVVSNHGGRRLDGMPSSIRMLPGVVEAVNGQAEVYMDSGVRRGTDVLKALALGARAVLIGRAYAWGLAADGENGVRGVLELFRQETALALASCGCARISDVSRELLGT